MNFTAAVCQVLALQQALRSCMHATWQLFTDLLLPAIAMDSAPAARCLTQC